jgi:hypothetical protein
VSNGATPLRQILLAYMLLVSILAAGWFVLGQPLREALARGETRLQAQQARVAALERIAAGDPALDPDRSRAEAERLHEFLDNAAIDAETVDVGSSLLRRALTDIVEKHGGEPGNTRISSDPDAATMTVSAQFETDLPSLVGMLYELETAQPLMFVDLLSIRRRDRYLPTEDGTDDPGLLVQIDVSAYWSGRPADGAN